MSEQHSDFDAIGIQMRGYNHSGKAVDSDPNCKGVYHGWERRIVRESLILGLCWGAVIFFVLLSLLVIFQ